MEKKIKKFNLFISGYKGLKVLELCYANGLSINHVYFYKAKISLQFYKKIKFFCIKYKIMHSEIGIRNISDYQCYDRHTSFFIGWQFKMNNIKNCLIFHDSLLPSYVGHSPTVSALINEEKKIGITLFEPNDEIDTGKISYQKEIKINYPMKILNAYNLITYEIYETINKFVNNKKLIFKKKNFKKIHSIWRDKKDYFINWHKNADYLQRFIDASGFPYEQARTCYYNKEIKIYDCQIIKNKKFAEYHPGKIVSIENNKPVVMCRDGLIQINISKYCDDKNVIYNSLRTRLT